MESWPKVINSDGPIATNSDYLRNGGTFEKSILFNFNKIVKEKQFQNRSLTVSLEK